MRGSTSSLAGGFPGLNVSSELFIVILYLNVYIDFEKIMKMVVSNDGLNSFVVCLATADCYVRRIKRQGGC